MNFKVFQGGGYDPGPVFLTNLVYIPEVNEISTG
jgi:hypothetical protein